MIRLENVSKYYHTDNNISIGIRKVNLSFDIGEFVVITGASGSGKTTLLNVISGMDKYEEGIMYINSEDTSYFSETDYETYRNNYISFVFQNFNLIESYSVYENIELALTIKGQTPKERKQLIMDIIGQVGLSSRRNYKVTRLSGGERQRVAIARALASGAPIIACDEITGNLDHDNGVEIIKLLKNISAGKLVLFVTHDPQEILPYATRLIRMHDGNVASDETIRPAEEAVAKQELQTKPLKGRELIRIALLNVFNTPKKSIFMFIILFITAIFISLSYSLYARRNFGTDFNQFTPNANAYPERIVIKKGDQTAFTDAEFTAMENMGGIMNLIKDDFVLDRQIFIKLPADVSDDNYYYEGIADFVIRSVEDLTRPQLKYGQLPAGENGIVVSVNSFINHSDRLVGKTVDIMFALGEVRPFIVTGVFIDDNASNAVYLSEAIMAQVEPAVETAQSSISFSGVNNVFGHFVVVRDETVLDDAMKIVVDRNNSGNLGDILHEYEGTRLSLNYENPYRKVSLNLLKLTIETESFSGSQAAFRNMDMGVIHLSPANYGRIVLDGKYQVSVTMDDVADPLKIIDKLNDKGFLAYHPSASSIVEIATVILGFFLLGISVLLMFVVYFISYISLRNIMLSKKKDYLIMRSLGMKSRNISRIVLLEVISSTLLSTILWLFGIFLVKAYASGPFFGVFRSLTAPDLTVVFIIMLLLAVLLSIRFARAIIKETIVTRILNQ